MSFCWNELTTILAEIGWGLQCWTITSSTDDLTATARLDLLEPNHSVEIELSEQRAFRITATDVTVADHNVST